MKIYGLTKLTLLDYPGLCACTIFTGGCNFRCPYCHNASIVLNNDIQEITEEEILTFLDKRKKLLDGVCVSGGEPTINSDLPKFIKKIKDKGYKVKLDTNGTNPKMLKNLIDKNLVDYVAMDIKNSLNKYAKTIDVKNYDITPIKESAEILLNGNLPYEFRTTVVKELHNENSFKDIAKWLKGGKAYFLQNFVDGKNLIGKNLSPCTKKEMEKYLDIVKKSFKICEIRGVN